VDAEHCTHAASRSFLDRFFGGQVAPFLSCFLERERLSPAELHELRRILDRKGT
jgi:BlaI family penicillinase repressor